MVKVVALEDGFYGGVYRRKGNVFYVEAGERSMWFTPEVDLSDQANEVKTPKKPAKAKQGE